MKFASWEAYRVVWRAFGIRTACKGAPTVQQACEHGATVMLSMFFCMECYHGFEPDIDGYNSISTGTHQTILAEDPSLRMGEIISVPQECLEGRPDEVPFSSK